MFGSFNKLFLKFHLSSVEPLKRIGISQHISYCLDFSFSNKKIEFNLLKNKGECKEF